MSSASTATAPEFTAVVLAATTGARLFPMTSTGTPKHLLPIGGIPIIIRLLHSVAACGFLRCIVTVAHSDDTTMTLVKQELGRNDDDDDDDDSWVFRSTNLKVTLYRLSEDCAGSAEAIRQVTNDVIPAPSDGNSSNLVVLPGDLVVLDTSVLIQLVDAHRQANLLPNNQVSTACTMLLADVGEQDEHGIPLKESSKQKKGGLAREEEDIEYIALSYHSSSSSKKMQQQPSTSPRVVWKQSKIDVEDDEELVGQSPKLVLPKSRLRIGQCQQQYVRVSRDWTDLHVYVLSPWIRTLIRERCQHTTMVSLQGDGIPLCVSRQFRGVRQTFGSRIDEDVVDDVMASFLRVGCSSQEDDSITLATVSPDTYSPSSDEYAVRAHVLDGWKALRANTIPSYLYACKEVMTRALDDPDGPNPCLFLPPNTTKNAKFHWIALEGSTFGEKVQCRSSTIGRRSTLGDRCKLNNVVVLDDVTIGENCVIQNSIIGAGCVIGDKCSLNDCQVSPGKVVPPMTKEKGESLIDDM